MVGAGSFLDSWAHLQLQMSRQAGQRQPAPMPLTTSMFSPAEAGQRVTLTSSLISPQQAPSRPSATTYQWYAAVAKQRAAQADLASRAGSFTHPSGPKGTAHTTRRGRARRPAAGRRSARSGSWG